jgi:hypothetical protein
MDRLGRFGRESMRRRPKLVEVVQIAVGAADEDPAAHYDGR